MMNYKIIKISPTEHNIVKVDTKEIVSTYTRMSSAKRGLVRLLARNAKLEQQESKECALVATKDTNFVCHDEHKTQSAFNTVHQVLDKAVFLINKGRCVAHIGKQWGAAYERAQAQRVSRGVERVRSQAPP